jgi:hypothetical protein
VYVCVFCVCVLCVCVMCVCYVCVFCVCVLCMCSVCVCVCKTVSCFGTRVEHTHLMGWLLALPTMGRCVLRIIGGATEKVLQLKMPPKSMYNKNCCIFEHRRKVETINNLYNRRACIRHQCRETTILSCHRCLIHTGVEKMNNI